MLAQYDSELSYLINEAEHLIAYELGLSEDPTNSGSFPSTSLNSESPSETQFKPMLVFTSGYFTVGTSGQVGVDYLFDGGSYEGELDFFSLSRFDGGSYKYEGELGIFSLSGLEQFNRGSNAFVQEVVRRILSDSTLGHLVIDAHNDAARFADSTGWEGNFNAKGYLGVKTVAMNPGDTFGVALLLNRSFEQIVGRSDIYGNIRLLFPFAPANPNQSFQFGQIADVTGHGSTFVLEDLRLDATSDRDYNDVIFQVRDVIGVAASLDGVIAKDWRGSDFGKTLLAYIALYDASSASQPIDYHFPTSNQPLIGIIDTRFAANNPDIDYNRITLGRDYVDGDINPLLNPGEGNEHSTHILGIIGATQNNGIDIDGINDQAPLWLGRAIDSGKWAESLVKFVNQALESNQPNFVNTTNQNDIYGTLHEQNRGKMHKDVFTIAQEYCKLSKLQSPTEKDIEKLTGILGLAQYDSELSCLINEADHLIAYELGLSEAPSNTSIMRKLIDGITVCR